MAAAQPMRLVIEPGAVSLSDDDEALELLVGSIMPQQAARYAQQVCHVA